MAAYGLENGIQPYAWGTTDAIADLLGHVPTGSPQAELWMGVHPGLPSRLPNGGTLRDLILSDPVLHLGPEVSRRFGQLPFLFKVLSAKTPLSLQAHPDQETATRGFALEEQAGIALSSPLRKYKDPSHKPEALCALTPFFALCGFRPFSEIPLMLSAFGCLSEKSPLLVLSRALEEAPSARALEDLIREIFALAPEARKRMVKQVAARALSPSHLESVQLLAPWMTRLCELHPEDPGVIVALLLRLEELAPGEALFLPAGILHAYLAGTGLEVMASSDNVLRGGLTEKFVDQEELCRVLTFEAGESLKCQRVVTEGEGVRVTEYPLSVGEFSFSLLDLFDERAAVSSRGPEVWLVLEGEMEISDEDGSRPLVRGQSLFCSAAGPVILRGIGRVARVRVPEE